MDQLNVHSNSLDSQARRKARRALACLLLLTIAYGAIVEAAHNHGFSAPRASQLTAVSDSSDSQPSHLGHDNHSDCSLCQFQRQLFGGLAQVVLVAFTPQQVTFLFKEAVSYLSTPALATFGRAPPLI